VIGIEFSKTKRCGVSWQQLVSGFVVDLQKGENGTCRGSPPSILLRVNGVENLWSDLDYSWEEATSVVPYLGSQFRRQK